MDNFFGFTICGLPGGDPYVNATRVDPVTLKCPAGKVPCSNNTSVENTICYPASNLTANCPITDIYLT